MTYQVTSKTTGITGNVILAGNGASGASYTVPWNGVGAGQLWNHSSVLTVSSSPTPGLQVSGDADIKGNLTVQGANVTEILTKIQDRLAILVPDPELLAKYQALREAYEHYRTLEALCVNTDSKER